MEDDNLYTLKMGDTFWGLESEWDIPYGTLQQLNPQLNPQNLKVGQQIKMPTLLYLVIEEDPFERKYPHFDRQECTMPIDNLRIHQPLGFASGVGRIRPNYISDYNQIAEKSSIYNRILGGVQMVGGALEIVLGGIGGILTSETGGGMVIGYIICANGVDNTITGFNQMCSGISEDTYLHTGVKEGAEMLGVDCNTAEKIATGAELSTILFGGVNGIKNSKNLKLMIKNTKGTKQIGLRATNTNRHLRLERHRFKGKMDTHFNYGENGAKHFPKRGRR